MNMAVQMNYGEPKAGMPGGLVDRSNYSAVTRRNGADTGKMLFGLGVVQGEEPGTDIALPATGATAAKFEGVTMYSANVEMDDEGNSGTMEGCTSYNFQYKCAVAETGVTRVLLTEAQAKNLLVGSSVIVGDVGSGTSTDRGVASMYKCAKNVRILSIVSTVVEETTYYAVNLETDTPFDTTTDTYISTMPWWSGSCDDVLGVDGSPTSCTNGKEPFIIQGLESQIGAYAVVADIIDTITVSEDSTTMTINPATVRLAKNIAQSKSANYVDTNKPLTIPKPANWAWHFIGDLAYDKAHPEFTLPSIIDNGANSGNGFKSAVYVPPSGGVSEWLSWSYLYDGSACGLACAALGSGLGNASWYLAAGAPGSGANRGEWAG